MKKQLTSDLICLKIKFDSIIQSILTMTSLIVHVKLAAGLENLDVQFPLKISPALYFGRIPCICGLDSGTSAI